MNAATVLLTYLEELGYEVSACVTSDGLEMTAKKDGESWVVHSRDPTADYEAALALCAETGVDLTKMQ